MAEPLRPSSPSDARHSYHDSQPAESPSGTLPLPSPLQQKTPARSYYQRSYHGSVGPSDPPYRTFESVREDTAELATRALTDADGSPPSVKPVPTASTSSSATTHSILAERGSPGQSSAPEPLSSLPETSGPDAQNVGTSIWPPSRTSILSQMIKHPQPDDEEAQAAQNHHGRDIEDFSYVTVGHGIISRQPQESTPLLRAAAATQTKCTPLQPDPGGAGVHARWHGPKVNAFLDRFRSKRESVSRYISQLGSPKAWNRARIQGLVMEPISCLPAVLLGLLLNVLDALSYGMILFPLSQPLFSELGPDGLSMFYVSCIVSQLVYSLGGSIFKGSVGSEMIEVVPFFHKMAFTIMRRVGEDKPHAVLATTILSYSLSSILTGLVFSVMGQCHLGSLIGFFPRHILIGCIGGVGFFLVVTGLEVSARIDGDLKDLDNLKWLIEPQVLPLWLIPLFLAFSLFLVKRWIRHSLTDAAFFISIIMIFYIVELGLPDVNLETLRSSGWVFEAPRAGVPWYHFYTLYDFQAVDWSALASTIPAMFALTFFGVLHVPINIPALGVSTGEDNVDVDRELRAHGLSNALSGLCGSIQNYLVYTNTVLFMRSGGDRRLAGFLLAIATAAIMFVGPVLIGYIPVMVVGALIFFLGFDLLREALVDTIGKVHFSEYLTVLSIVLVMGAYDFVIGILVGIVLACVGYVMRTSRISAIRVTSPGGLATSTVRRHPLQAVFLQEVGQQIHVMRLAGYLFFGTIVGVENRIRALLREEAFSSRPIQFLVIDLSNVDGVDFSSAEAVTRINRLLQGKNVRMIICGFTLGSDVGKSLRNVGLLEEADGVEYFEGLNPALEYCENQLLRAFYQRKDDLDRQQTEPEPKAVDVSRADQPPALEGAFFGSPRRGQLHAAAKSTLEEHKNITPHHKWQAYSHPLQLILQTFAGISTKDEVFWRRSVPYFQRREYQAGAVLYRSGDRATEFYILQSGILKAKYQIPQGPTFSEVIVPGTTCGELPFFSETPRTSTTFADRKSVVWYLDQDNWSRLQAKEPAIAQELLKLSLSLTSERMNTITKYMLLRGT